MTCTLAADADAADTAERLGSGLASADPRGLIDCWAIRTGDRTLEIVAIFEDAERATPGRADLERMAGKDDRLTVGQVREGAAHPQATA